MALTPTEKQINEIKSWRDDPTKKHHQPHVDRWERVLAIWGQNQKDVEPMTIQEIETYADKGWGRWITIQNLYYHLESKKVQQDNQKTAVIAPPVVAPEEEEEVDDPIRIEDTDLDAKLDPRGRNQPWRFLTDDEKIEIERALDEAYKYNYAVNVAKLNAILHDNENPPKDYFSPQYVAQKAKSDGSGLIERAIKWALEGKAWDQHYIDQASKRYGLDEAALKALYDQKIEEINAIKKRQKEKDSQHDILPDLEGPISWHTETPIYPKRKGQWGAQWDQREDQQLFYKNGIHNNEKNKILNELPVLLYPEDFDRDGLIAEAPIEAKVQFYRLLRFCGDSATDKSIFRSHLLGGLRRNKGYSLVDILPSEQTWSVDGKRTAWAIDHNERRSYFLNKRRAEIQKVRQGDKEVAAFVEEKQLQASIKGLVSKGDYESIGPLTEQLKKVQQYIIDQELVVPQDQIAHGQFILPYQYDKKGQRI